MKILIILYLCFITFTKGRIGDETFAVIPPIFHGDDILDDVDFSNIVENDFLMKGIGGLTNIGKGNSLVKLVQPTYHFMNDFKEMQHDFLKSNVFDGFSGIPHQAHVVFGGYNHDFKPNNHHIRGKFPNAFSQFNLKPQHHFISPEHNYHINKPLGFLKPPLIGNLDGYGYPNKPHGGGGIKRPRFPFKLPKLPFKLPRLPRLKRPRFLSKRPKIGPAFPIKPKGEPQYPFKGPFLGGPRFPLFKGPKGMKPPSVEIPGIPILEGPLDPDYKTDIKKAYLKKVKLDDPVHPSALKPFIVPLPGISGKIPSSFNPLSVQFTGLESFNMPVQNNFNLLTKNLQFHKDITLGLPPLPPKTDITKAILKDASLDEPLPPIGLPQIPIILDDAVNPEIVVPEDIILHEIIDEEIPRPSLTPAEEDKLLTEIVTVDKPYASVTFSKEDDLDFTLIRSGYEQSFNHPHPVDQNIAFSEKGSILRAATGGLVHEDKFSEIN